MAKEIKDDAEVSGGWLHTDRRIYVTGAEADRLEAAGINLEYALRSRRIRGYDPYTIHDAEGNNITDRAREIVTPILGEPIDHLSLPPTMFKKR